METAPSIDPTAWTQDLLASLGRANASNQHSLQIIGHDPVIATTFRAGEAAAAVLAANATAAADLWCARGGRPQHIEVDVRAAAASLVSFAYLRYQGATFETVTWACGLLASTRRLTVFGTVHAPLIAPLIAAKEFVTADHIGEGRFGLNLVCGWNEGEFEMFGATLRDHEARYEYAQEWLDIVKLAWSPQTEFDFAGQYFKLKGVRTKPKPYGGTRPLVMNAGASATGQAFAIRNCDALFSNVSRGISFEETAGHIKNVRALGRQAGREIDVYTVGVVTCRPTASEAHEYYRHAVVDNADWAAVDNILAMKNITPQTHSAQEFQRIRDHQANGMGGLPLVGDPDAVARGIARLAELGLRGIAVSFVNYLDELPYFCAEVLPRLARAGLRDSRAPGWPD